MKKAVLLLLTLIFPLSIELTGKTILRIGYFPNITHAQGIIGSHTSREGRGWFEKRLGPDVEIEWYAFNAGPSAMESIFAKSIDLSYVGPNPALNAYIVSRGHEVRVLAGAAEGGAALLIPKDLAIKSPTDFKGKRIGTPQFGNTQDIAARSWLKANGLRITMLGGDAKILPASNPDLLSLFMQKNLEGAWTVEPWVSRIELEAGGKVYLEQKDALTTLLVARKEFLEQKPELAQKFLQAHIELTQWINSNSSEARELVRKGLSAEVRREMPKELIDHAWPRLHFTSNISLEQFDKLIKEAQSVGFLRNAIPLNHFIIPQKK